MVSSTSLTLQHANRVQAVGLSITSSVERARQPGQADSPTTLADNQRAYVALIDALVAEEGYALDQCRGVA